MVQKCWCNFFYHFRHYTLRMHTILPISMTIRDGGAPECHLGMFLVCTLRILWLTVARGPTVVQILFPLLDHPDHGDEDDNMMKGQIYHAFKSLRKGHREIYV